MPTVQQHSEETYPLLLLFLDDESARGRRVQIDKNRYHRIATGASTVITEWPNHLSPCWILSLLCGLFVFLITLLALSAATANSVRYERHLNTRCIASHVYDYKKLSNETVHLIHGSDVWTKNQIAVLEGVLRNYNTSKVHLVVVGYNKSEVIPEKSTIYRKVKNGDKIKQINIEEPIRKRRALLKTKLEDLLRLHPDIILEILNYTEAFNNSPLYNTWRNLNEKTRLFAIRVIYLWQYGGISFDLLENSYRDSSRYKQGNNNKTTSLENIVILGLTTFKKLPKGIVTIDDKGWHMESRTSCHAFFGDMLINLRTANFSVTPEDIIKRTLDVFCKKGAIDSGYCSTVKR